MSNFKKDLVDINDLTALLQKLSTRDAIIEWVKQWQTQNQAVDGTDWSSSFPCVADMTIRINIESGTASIWVEKELFENGQVIRLSQQVF
jgi:hypothetical protein